MEGDFNLKERVDTLENKVSELEQMIVALNNPSEIGPDLVSALNNRLP